MFKNNIQKGISLSSYWSQFAQLLDNLRSDVLQTKGRFKKDFIEAFLILKTVAEKGKSLEKSWLNWISEHFSMNSKLQSIGENGIPGLGQSELSGAMLKLLQLYYCHLYILSQGFVFTSNHVLGIVLKNDTQKAALDMYYIKQILEEHRALPDISHALVLYGLSYELEVNLRCKTTKINSHQSTIAFEKGKEAIPEDIFFEPTVTNQNWANDLRDVLCEFVVENVKELAFYLENVSEREQVSVLDSKDVETIFLESCMNIVSQRHIANKIVSPKESKQEAYITDLLPKIKIILESLSQYSLSSLEDVPYSQRRYLKNRIGIFQSYLRDCFEQDNIEDMQSLLALKDAIDEIVPIEQVSNQYYDTAHISTIESTVLQNVCPEPSPVVKSTSSTLCYCYEYFGTLQEIPMYPFFGESGYNTSHRKKEPGDLLRDRQVSTTAVALLA